MESARMGWMALALLGLMLAAAPVREAQLVYYVGNIGSNPNWYPQVDSNFYQNWADTLTLYVNDSLLFLFDSQSHDVTQLADSTDLLSCSIVNRVSYYKNGGFLTLTIQETGTFYLTSTGLTSTVISSDCQEGMLFSIFVLPRYSSPPPPGPISSADPGGTPNTDQEQKGKTKFPVAVVVAVSVGIISIVVLAVVGFLYCRWKCGPRGRYQEQYVVKSDRFENSSGQASAAIDAYGILKGNAAAPASCTIFTYAEMERAANGFAADNVAGSGGFGTVYKGTLDDGRTVAIKKAKQASDVESFVNEVAILSQVNNRNLVKLLGYCIEVAESPLLVYEFIPNGTLQDHLSLAQKGFNTRLNWDTRFRIALQTAEALKYLHVDATPPIFHRDVKTANILLDNNFNGKVADFGLSKLGTPGYLDPDYYHNFQLTDKTDVYSFGMVLLELITSKKPIDLSNPARMQNLAVFATPLIKSGRVREIIDPFMSPTLSQKELHAVEAVAQVAVACLVSSRDSRPSMSEVVEMLQRIKGSTLKAEEFYAKADGIRREHSIIEMQDYGIPLRYSGSTSSGTSSSGSRTATAPMRPR